MTVLKNIRIIGTILGSIVEPKYCDMCVIDTLVAKNILALIFHYVFLRPNENPILDF